MTAAVQIRRNQHEVMLEYTSAQGAEVTHARGTLLVNSIENLRAMGLLDAYTELLPAAMRDAAMYALASSWVPVGVLVAHYDACDRLAISDQVVARAGQMTADRLSAMFFSRVLRLARDGGVDTLPRAITESGRLMERLYQGGSCAVLRTGPKDLIVETYGLPFSRSLYYRSIYLSYFHVAASLLCRRCYVKYTQPRRPGASALAIACSWV